MKKAIKKILSKIFPKGNVKEKFKLHYYSFFKPKNVLFEVGTVSDKIIYITKFDNISIKTNEALYPIVDDFNYYQHFYKVKQNDIVIDAGANCGHLSIFFSKIVGSNGKIFAFEPDKFNIERILKNISLNDDLSNNIQIEDVLLWDKNELISFYEAGTVGSSAVWMPDDELCVKKQAVRIDDWVKNNNIQKLDFIKMDIEGAEIEALDGCIETIKTLRPNFAIASYHFVNGEQTFIKVEQFFSAMNYPYKTVKFRGTEIITFAGFNLK
ncbi:FkbM family methyltransferase [Flavobacterium capsici]|uniref:FkbM family methyltransferase n=1 Tax=Flavobacterium capsici TaxID=3075618 RepID=A0AA96J988_9FLAO|nr:MULTISPECIES: FkbM family methyltransferase [unclassified Flavobacterium]WNM20264.1 FkbM family methyltransferase [Flavobacterium sp. PMR2A8]WNM21654.1 FkbM family methyltransferase [Flavobacterium sp. PMTSA4]